MYALNVCTCSMLEEPCKMRPAVHRDSCASYKRHATGDKWGVTQRQARCLTNSSARLQQTLAFNTDSPFGRSVFKWVNEGPKPLARRCAASPGYLDFELRDGCLQIFQPPGIWRVQIPSSRSNLRLEKDGWSTFEVTVDGDVMGEFRASALRPLRDSWKSNDKTKS